MISPRERESYSFSRRGTSKLLMEKKDILSCLLFDFLTPFQAETHKLGFAELFSKSQACIAQDHPELKAMSIALLERFIQMCDSMCVLFTWTYLERLWCRVAWPLRLSRPITILFAVVLTRSLFLCVKGWDSVEVCREVAL